MVEHGSRSIAIAALGLFVGLGMMGGMVGAALVLERPLGQAVKFQDKLSVKGYAEERVRSDMAKWTGRVSVRDPDLQKAYANLRASREKVEAFLDGSGFADASLDISPIHTMVHYRYSPTHGMTNEVQAYELSHTITVTSADVDRIDAMSRDVTGLMQDGVMLMSHAPQYYFTELEDLKIALLAAATENAHVRARTLAESSGARAGALRSARQGVFQVTSAISTETSDYGMYDTSSIDKAVKAVVTVEFAID
ncbi:MAG: SIMPL domain-containing protein [Sphingomonadales bacterium]